MNISVPYAPYFEERLQGRYLALKHIEPLLDGYRDTFAISSIGTSEEGRDIHCVKIGSGPKVVLGWSQMHGNESTTTKALFDFLKLMYAPGELQKEVKAFLEGHTVYWVPMLNPDGAARYTRENINGVDLNRDAQDRTQLESRALNTLFKQLQPQLCLNLHGQRTLYSLPNRQCATVSFLAPAANTARDLTTSRRVAMEEIVRMRTALEPFIPGKIGRYDDTFNINCVGDTFQMAGASTILFEAGHYPDDYPRQKSREAIFRAFLCLFGMDGTRSGPNADNYLLIPENEQKFKDVILRNVGIAGKPLMSLAINYQEVLENEHIRLQPRVDSFGDLDDYYGHEEIDVKGANILLNSYENVFENEKVATIVDKNSINRVFFKDSCNII